MSGPNIGNDAVIHSLFCGGGAGGYSPPAVILIPRVFIVVLSIFILLCILEPETVVHGSSHYSTCDFFSTSDECPGTASNRLQMIHARVESLNLELMDSYSDIRLELTSACGLQPNVRQTSHCFADFNHVDCCPIMNSHSENTNKESKIPGMHSVNTLDHVIDKYSEPMSSAVSPSVSLFGGTAVVDVDDDMDMAMMGKPIDNDGYDYGAVAGAGTGAQRQAVDNNGSWCTCHLSTPYDVCHQQFGAQIAFKLIWCPNPATTTAAAAADFAVMIIDNDVNVLNWVMLVDGNDRRQGMRTKQMNWSVIEHSSNHMFKTQVKLKCTQIWQQIKHEL